LLELVGRRVAEQRSPHVLLVLLLSATAKRVSKQARAASGCAQGRSRVGLPEKAGSSIVRLGTEEPTGLTGLVLLTLLGSSQVAKQASSRLLVCRAEEAGARLSSGLTESGSGIGRVVSKETSSSPRLGRLTEQTAGLGGTKGVRPRVPKETSRRLLSRRLSGLGSTEQSTSSLTLSLSGRSESVGCSRRAAEQTTSGFGTKEPTRLLVLLLRLTSEQASRLRCSGGRLATEPESSARLLRGLRLSLLTSLAESEPGRGTLSGRLTKRVRSRAWSEQEHHSSRD
jgi:hypothetical protein